MSIFKKLAKLANSREGKVAIIVAGLVAPKLVVKGAELVAKGKLAKGIVDAVD